MLCTHHTDGTATLSMQWASLLLLLVRIPLVHNTKSLFYSGDSAASIFLFLLWKQQSWFLHPWPASMSLSTVVSSNSNPQRVSFLFSKTLRRITDLINWSLNAIDTLCSVRSLGSEEPKCPGGTFPARYMMDGGRSGTSCAWRDCLLRTLKTSTYSEPCERGSC